MKDVKFYFRMGSILVFYAFMNNKRAMYIYFIFEFMIFKKLPNRRILSQNNHNYHRNFPKNYFFIQNINEITLIHAGLT